jgi:hypothetical protein
MQEIKKTENFFQLRLQFFWGFVQTKSPEAASVQTKRPEAVSSAVPLFRSQVYGIDFTAFGF